ncbi:MAG: type VI secretion system tip protein TssI/VgrG [Planctomycetota bacterium]
MNSSWSLISGRFPSAGEVAYSSSNPCRRSFTEVLAGIETQFDLVKDYPAHNLCVQYDESDFQFASRLMEEEGIHYYFEHSLDGDRLVLADDSTKSARLAESANIPFGFEGSGDRQGGWIHHWRKSQRLTIGKSVLRDFCFERSNKPIVAETSLADEIQVGSVMHHLLVGGGQKRLDQSYPAGFTHRFDSVGPQGAAQSSALSGMDGDGRRTAKLRIEQAGAAAVEIHGVSNCGHLLPGNQFSLQGHFNGNGDYFITKVKHTLQAPDFRPGATPGWTYENSFHSLPASLPYRPTVKTPHAVVRGTQTAIVQGVGSDPIWTDKFGRIKVRFHWQTDDEADASAWIRVAQGWAGSGWGMVNIPRANQEVVVGFLDGDPDCPIVLGSVYNQENMPPFELPTYKTLSGIKSDSQQSAETSSFNGLSFNDKDGEEEIHLRSQKDMVLYVKNNHLASVNGQNFEHTGSVRFKSVGGFPTPGGSGSGSGGGAGEVADDAVGWGWGLAKSKLGQDYATNIGIEARKGIGRCTTSVYGGGSSAVIDPMAWSDEFAIPIHAKLATVIGLILGSGREDVVYGQFVDLSLGARSAVTAVPFARFAGSSASDKYPFRMLAARLRSHHHRGAIVEEILGALKKNNVDTLVGINAGALLLQAGLGWFRKRSERVLFNTLEAALKVNDGSGDAIAELLKVPSSYCNKTRSALTHIQQANAAEALKDPLFQKEPSESRSAHRIIVDGPYSVKSSGMLELTTYAEESAGASRINLADNNLLLAADDLVSVQGGKGALIEAGSGTRIYGGSLGAVRIGSGLTANQKGAVSQAEFTPTDMTLSVGPSGKNPTQVNMAASTLKLGVGAPNACAVVMDGTSITLKCGKNSIVINSSGVTLTGTLIKLAGQSGIQHTSSLVKIGG